MKKFWFLFSSLFVLPLYLPLQAEPLPLPSQAHIIIDAVGEFERIPDIIELDIDVLQTAANFNSAKKAVDAIVDAAITAALAQGVLDDDINASQISATPQYRWKEQEKIYLGEQVSRQLHIRLKRPEKYNDLVEALLGSGVSRLNNARFTFSNLAELEKLALEMALDNARQQASNIAAHMKIKLGPVFQIAPIGPVAYPRVQMLQMAESKSDHSSLKPGKQTIRQQVRVVYLLGEP
jgi:hypothetical protein